MNSDIVSYYKARAAEYDRIYSKPERQQALQQAGQILQDIFRDKEVFEIACGTGYWTQQISQTAHSILATDINDTMIEVAKSKQFGPAKIDFQLADIFNLTENRQYQSLFGGFFWSHIKLEDLPHFIDITNTLVEPGGPIVFMDNNYVDGSNLPIADRDESGNTYQTRILDNGTTHKVLKNFPTRDFILQLLADKASDLDFIKLEYYWILKYESR